MVQSIKQVKPLAEQVRPQAWGDLLGQEKIWSENSALRKLVENDTFHSLIFWGPPGCGKTSLAGIICHMSEREMAFLSAVSAGVKEIREQIQRSLDLLTSGQKGLVLFMDEIHRLNKAQQDVLLPVLENGTIKFIGATTENPSFEVNSAINSRSLIFKFEKMSESSLVAVQERALAREDSSVMRRDFAPEVLAAIARSAAGDARRALNLLEAAAASAPREESPITIASLAAFTDSLTLKFDRQGDEHYDTISAFIKCIRASDPDGAIYYLARMIAAGEDPVFIGRRLLIAASEDIGNANPTALLVATAAFQAADVVGFPEARIILAQATTYLASSPKSNRSYQAINKAGEDVRQFGALEIPLHIRNAPTALMKEFGYGKGYIYAHDDPQGARDRQYLPEKLKDRIYYDPVAVGTEKVLKAYLDEMRPMKNDKTGYGKERR